MNRRRKTKEPAKEPDDINVLIKVRTNENTRARVARRSKLYAFGFQIAVVLIAVVVVGLMLRHAFIRAFVESEHFTLNRVEVVTNGRIERPQVMAATGVRERSNLLEYDLKSIREKALALPQVESIEVERILPDALRITLRERVPVAWISCLPAGWRARTATSGLLVDEDGRLFRCESLAPDLLGLAVIELVDATGLEPGTILPPGNARAALELVTDLDRSNDATLPRLAEVAVRNGYALEITLENGETAWLSPEEPIEDFRRLVLMIEHFQRLDQTITFANLLPRKNVAIRLAATEKVPVRRAREATPPDGTANSVPANNRSTPDVRAILNRR
ncbi:MAG: cell division protein FtsQ/DivIB [Verrucomicrobiales bacterium]